MIHSKTALALLVGVIACLSVPAGAAGRSEMSGASSSSTKSEQVQLAQRPYDPSAGSVGYKQKGAQTAQRAYDPSAGSVGYKQKAKKKKKKTKKK